VERDLLADAPLLASWQSYSSRAVTPFTIPGHKGAASLLWPVLASVLAGDVPLYGGLDSVKLAAGVLADAARRFFYNRLAVGGLVVASAIVGAAIFVVAGSAVVTSGPSTDVVVEAAHLPPLLTMEALLFRIIWAGFILLTATLASGVVYSEELFGRAARFNHKTVFGVLSWVIFAALLGGRHAYGWRGRVAVRWTLTGFLMLVLAYIGSKFVLEVILGRG